MYVCIITTINAILFYSTRQAGRDGEPEGSFLYINIFIKSKTTKTKQTKQARKQVSKLSKQVSTKVSSQLI